MYQALLNYGSTFGLKKLVTAELIEDGTRQFFVYGRTELDESEELSLLLDSWLRILIKERAEVEETE